MGLSVWSDEYETLISVPQPGQDGAIFHFMHQRLRDAAFNKLIELRDNK